MTEPKGWWLAVPFLDGRTFKMLADPAPPPSGPADHDAAFLGEGFGRAQDPARLLNRVASRLRVGGRLALWWRAGEAMRPADTVALLTGLGFDCIEDDAPDPGFAFQLFERSERRGEYRPWRRPEKAALVLRIGGYGDHLMAASVLPGLKAEGWNVTYLGTHEGLQVLRHDPNIDRFLHHRRNNVPTERLVEFMLAFGSRFDRVIDLNATVERDVLYRPDQYQFWREDGARRRLCVANYLEHTARVAGVPYRPGRLFHMNAEETRQAEAFAGAHAPLIMLCLAGSSEYKVWPWAAQFVVRALIATDARIALAGGPRDEARAEEIMRTVKGYVGDASRVLPLIGADMRTTMSIARRCRAVIGPETGVMHAVAFEQDVAKIVMLSHSSHANLTRDWPETWVIVPEVACHPCHRLHETTEHCPRDAASGHAACAGSISVDTMMTALRAALGVEESAAAAPNEPAPSAEIMVIEARSAAA